MMSILLSTPCAFGKSVFVNSKIRSFMYTARQMQYVRQMSGSGSTVDQSEIQHHSKQSGDWWDPAGSMKALHSFNLIRIPLIRDGLVDISSGKISTTPLKGVSILDIGCGGGILSEPLARLGASVTGVDASKELIEVARNHACADPKLAKNMPNYICTTIEEHAPAHENYYDGVVASEIIEHINNKALFVKLCVQALKPGGRIFFTTPTRTWMSQFTVIYLAENVFKTIPQGTHQIEKFMPPNELTFLLEKNDCQVELIHGILYNVITNSWHWVNYHNFLFAVRAIKLK